METFLDFKVSKLKYYPLMSTAGQKANLNSKMFTFAQNFRNTKWILPHYQLYNQLTDVTGIQQHH